MDWQPKETAPRDGSWFLTYSPDSSSPYDVASFDVEYDDFCKYGCGWQYVSHWAPLQPPQGA